MAKLNEYTFIVTKILTGEIINVVDLSSFYWEDIYLAPGEAQATARLDLPTTTTENFADWENMLWAVKGNSIKFGGIIGKTQRRAGSRVLNVPIHGLWGYFRDRFLKNADGMTYGKLVRSNEVEWRNVDYFHIVEDVINHTKAFQNGDIGVDVVYDSLSGQTATKIHRTYSRKRIARIVEELSVRLNGFDFRIEYYWQGNIPKARLRLDYPAHKITSTDLLLHQTQYFKNESIAILKAIDLDGISDISTSTTISVSGDLTLILNLKLPDWTPTINLVLNKKWIEVTNQRSWRFTLLTTGQLQLEWSTDGTAGTVITEVSDNPNLLIDNEEGYIQVYLDVDDGAGSYAIEFFYSTDGQNWIPLQGPRQFGDEFGDEF